MPTPSSHAKLLKLVPALVLIAFALPSSAFGATSRSWVSGTGDDANPCSRTKPCKTFAGALPKTAAGGVIGCLDPGGYGTVVIQKSITLKCSDTDAGILAAGTNAIVVNAAATDKVTLKGFDINGAGTGAQTALTGVKVVQAASVHILDSEISRFKTGVWVGGSSSTVRVLVANSHIHDNGIGVFTGPRSDTVDAVVATLHDNVIADNGCGVVTSSAGASTSTPDASASECGSAAAPGHNRTAVASIFGNGIYDNGEGVHVRGQNAFALVAYNQITGNTAFGMHRLDSGTLETYTPATNVIANNAASDPPNSFVAQTKRQAKRNRRR
jgi:hypothetical protein